MTAVDWPSAFERTDERDRKYGEYGINASAQTAAQDIIVELDKLRALDSAEIQTALAQDGNVPRLDAAGAVEDPAVVVRFRYDGTDCVLAADASERPRDNLIYIRDYLRFMQAAHGDRLRADQLTTTVSGTLRT